MIKRVPKLDKELTSFKNLCSYTLKCNEFKIDFIPKNKKSTFRLYKNSKEIYSLYPIKESSDFFLKIYMNSKDYQKKVSFLHKELALYLFITFLAIILLSTLFSFYALYPLHQALLLTREFIKDICRDVNTPMSHET